MELENEMLDMYRVRSRSGLDELATVISPILNRPAVAVVMAAQKSLWSGLDMSMRGRSIASNEVVIGSLGLVSLTP